MNFLFDARLRRVAFLQVFAGGIFIATLTFIFYGILTQFSPQALSYFYFFQAIFILMIFIAGQKRMQKKPLQFARYFYWLGISLPMLFWLLLQFEVRWVSFIAAVILTSMQLQLTTVIANSITLSLDSREFRNAGSLLVITYSASGTFFGIALPFLIYFTQPQILLPILSIFYLSCFLMSRKLIPLYELEHPKTKQAKPLKNRLIRILFAYGIMAVSTLVLFDYILRYSIHQHFESTQIAIITSLAAGAFCLSMSLTQVVKQTWLINKLGISGILWIYPIFGLIGAIIILLFPSFLPIAFIVTGAYGILTSYNYVANNALLNALPAHMRFFGRSVVFLIVRIIGSACIASVILWLLGKYANPRYVSFAIIIISLIALLIVPLIRREYRGALKIFSEKRNYEIYAHLMAESLEVHSLDQLLKEIENTSNPIFIQKRLILLCRMGDAGVEKALLKLLKNPHVIFQNALAQGLAIRALRIEPDAELAEAIRSRLFFDSKVIFNYRSALAITKETHLRREIESRLFFAKKRFLYWLAALDSSGAIMRTLPNIMGHHLYAGRKTQRAHAFDYLDTLLPSFELRKLLHDSFDSNITDYAQTDLTSLLNQDPWLTRIVLGQKNQEKTMNIEDKIFVLRSQNLFASLPAEILELIAEQLQEKQLKAGEILFRMGDLPDRVYMIKSGEMILKNDTQILSTLTKGIFGEMGLLDNSPRVATAEAKKDSILLSLDIQEFNQLLDDIPLLSRAIIQQLLGYLRLDNKSQDKA